MKRKHRKNDIIKLGSETEASNGVYHLLRDGDRGKYAVWVQPYDTWQGKKSVHIKIGIVCKTARSGNAAA